MSSCSSPNLDKLKKLYAELEVMEHLKGTEDYNKVVIEIENLTSDAQNKLQTCGDKDKQLVYKTFFMSVMAVLEQFKQVV